jgi:hypothetical protein
MTESDALALIERAKQEAGIHIHPESDEEFKSWYNLLKKQGNHCPANTWMDFFSREWKIRLYRFTPVFK